MSGPTGLEALEVLIVGAREWLVADGAALVVELAPHQAEWAAARAGEAGFDDVGVTRDLVGRERVLVARVGGNVAS